MLVHWPAAFQQREDDNYVPTDANGKIIFEHVDIIETWNAFEKLVDLGYAKHIGVSNFSIEQLERIRYSEKVKIQPYCNQIEGHLYLQQPVMTRYLAERKIYLTFFSCLGRATLQGPFGVPLIKDPVLEEVAKEVGKTTAQTNLRFLKQLSPYNVVIPMSNNPVNIKGNFELDFTLSEEQMNKLKSRDRAFRFVDPWLEWGVDALNLGH
ncbi:oxidoreductase, aldo/keto reductase family protein [Trichomonas vaginalis G3]|uniref:Oxidoreductase, aldo/keto reductase family protein n=1 Tax=Trichomonas vaginalis (strain ATCC PRA-98 / G3) TaxID=412133 RepID=A2E8D0_TRIV3|nr:oxidoreductase protein [Trichomonas vaginalis G3]EAY11058.1 oxidoreductase, aldo/keto reductase family protein [Trichomonas vaginalis G3]KAI5520520.1 oxidoreductase protein [Trichomonas vaginalis G3]|eukprot:XP_001323281.1 oxidoreductase, aldo/keto reductase family protein [Trichomonas vaginalis G3]